MKARDLIEANFAKKFLMQVPVVPKSWSVVSGRIYKRAYKDSFGQIWILTWPRRSLECRIQRYEQDKDFTTRVKLIGKLDCSGRQNWIGVQDRAFEIVKDWYLNQT